MPLADEKLLAANATIGNCESRYRSRYIMKWNLSEFIPHPRCVANGACRYEWKPDLFRMKNYRDRVIPEKLHGS